MALSARDHVPALAGILSVVSLGLVFAAALRLIPPTLLPQAPRSLVAAIPHVNAGLSILAILVIGYGWRAIRRDRIDRHRLAMLTGTVLFAGFLVLYLYKVALDGPTAFPGPTVVFQYLYLPLLAIHILLAIICIPLLYYVLLLGLTRPVHEIPLTAHPRVGRIAVPLWLTSFSLGIAVYVLLYHLY